MIIPDRMNEWLPLNGWMSDYTWMDECMITLEWINEWIPLNGRSTAWTL